MGTGTRLACRAFYVFVGLVLVGVSSCASPPAPSTATPTPPLPLSAPEGRAEAAGEVLRLIDEIRAERGLPPYRVHPAYTETAQMRADQIVDMGHFSHYGPGGENLLYDALLITQSPMGNGGSEILAANGNPDSASGPAGAVVSWMESGSHRQVVVSEEYYLVGVGVAWAGDGMDFDWGEGRNLGVGGVYVVIAGAGGELHLVDWDEELAAARARGEEVDVSRIVELARSRKH
jgi:uncharacterized protein YkwD